MFNIFNKNTLQSKLKAQKKEVYDTREKFSESLKEVVVCYEKLSNIFVAQTSNRSEGIEILEKIIKSDIRKIAASFCSIMFYTKYLPTNEAKTKRNEFLKLFTDHVNEILNSLGYDM